MVSPAPAVRLPVASASPDLSFLFASDQETLIGRGVQETVVTAVRDGLVEHAVQVLGGARTNGSSGPAALVGAVPFDPRVPAQLVRPDRLEKRSGGGLVPADLSVTDAPRAVPSWRVTADPSRSEYAASVADALARIGGPEGLRKVVLARSLVIDSDQAIDLDRLLVRLCRDRSATTFMVPLPTDGPERRCLVGASPELLISKQGAIVISHPLAGSARRSADPSEDSRAAANLARSDKDRREHASVVEWVVDRLRPFCSSLTVPPGPSLVSTETMWHLGTRITGTLRDPAISSLELATVLHPTPAVCGQPPEAAARAIDQLEAFDRGYFGGAVGWCDATGDGRWFVTIRCAEVCDTSARLYAGAGIVAGSDPDAETAETSAKFAALLRALGIDEEGRALTME